MRGKFDRKCTCRCHSDSGTRRTMHIAPCCGSCPDCGTGRLSSVDLHKLRCPAVYCNPNVSDNADLKHHVKAHLKSVPYPVPGMPPSMQGRPVKQWRCSECGYVGSDRL